MAWICGDTHICQKIVSFDSHFRNQMNKINTVFDPKCPLLGICHTQKKKRKKKEFKDIRVKYRNFVTVRL